MSLTSYNPKLIIFHKNAKFLSNLNKFWVLQNSDPIIKLLGKINKKASQICLQHMTL